jgi:hypothetical protein
VNSASDAINANSNRAFKDGVCENSGLIKLALYSHVQAILLMVINKKTSAKFLAKVFYYLLYL